MNSNRVGVDSWGIVIGLLLVSAGGARWQAARGEAAQVVGQAFDAAPFGMPLREEGGKAYGVRWPEPRKIRRVVVEFESSATVPDPAQVRVQYWHRVWDGRPDPILAETAAGGEGWTAMDDWSNGGWRDAATRVQADGRRWEFTFAPTGDEEFKDLGQPGVAFRKTLKVRLLAAEALPPVARFHAFTDAVCRPLTVRIMWGRPAEPTVSVDRENKGHLEVYNGSVAAVRPVAGVGAAGDDLGWTLPAGGEGAVEADLIMAADPISERYDRTVVTVRTDTRPFSFAADEAARGDRILVNDLGVLVVRGDDGITLEGYRAALKEFPGRTIYDRVAKGPEQSLTRAWSDMPIKHPLWFVHGLPANRNAMRQEPNGGLAITNVRHWFHRPNYKSPKDSDRKLWEGDYLTLRFGFPDDEHRTGRALEEGYLPLLRTRWLKGSMLYEQATILDKLDADLGGVRLDDPTVLLMKVRVLNTSPSASDTARLFLTADAKEQEKLNVDGDRVLAKSGDGDRLRCLVKTGDRGTLHPLRRGVEWTLELGPSESHELFFAIPSITLTEDAEIDALRRRDFDADTRRICDFWRGLTAQGAQISTPEPWINDFYKAHLRHLEVNCLGDLETARRYAHVGTFHYGVYSNESSMMISDLDRRGYHDAAEQCLQTWLDFQGTAMLPGNFKSKEGLFYGANGSQSGGYNKHHGYTMWCMAEHWWYTRDRAWMEQAAPHLIAACDWVIRERKATMRENEDGTRPIEYGFLPAGGLEDVQDYWYWLATNACTVWGFDAVAAALTDFGHPDAERIMKEAEDYHRDVMNGIVESRIRAPVVRLRDATYVPKYPSRLYERGRCVGWIRETLEGSLCLLLTGLVAPDSPDARWIMKDYEDNLYISERYGYSIPVFDRFWFSRGGISMQANLLDSPMPYIHMDDTRHFLRAYFNGFASAFYPEIRMCNEHSLPELGYPAGDHFKTSDEANSTYWLRLMFVYERGKDLYLGRAVPRDWQADGMSVSIERSASHFGPLSLRLTSRANTGEMEARVTPPERTPPENIYVRLRHPHKKPIQSVTVNGEDYKRFDPEKEWVILPGSVRGEQLIVARY